MADYYTLEETLQRLHKDEAGIKNLVVEGKLREFRQDGKLFFKREDVDALTGGAPMGLSTTGDELVLEPAEGSTLGDIGPAGGGMDLSAGGDLLSLADDEEEPKSGEEPKKDDTVVTSVGVNVFEGEELGLEADPAAKTVLSDSDSGKLDADSEGSASGLLDLSREKDDTSLGHELLDEIYPEGEGAPPGDSTKAGLVAEIGGQGTRMGSGTRAGTGTQVGVGTQAGTGIVEGSDPFGGTELGGGSGSGSGTALDQAFAAEAATPAVAPAMESAQSLYMPDPYAGAFTGVMLVTVAVLGLAGAVCAAFLRGAWPAYLGWISNNLLLFGGATAGLAVVVLGVGYFMSRPSSPPVPKPKKEKKKKEKSKK